jgi:hypothetical protein
MIPKGINFINEEYIFNKDSFSKEIEANNLLVNNDKYTKNFIDIDINLANNKKIGSIRTKYKTPSKTTKPVIPPINNQNQKIKNDNINNNQKKIQKNNIPKGNNIPTNANTNTSKNNKQKNNLQKKQKTSNFPLNNNKEHKENKIEDVFNSNISIISSSTNKNVNMPKDRIKVMINKIENIYKEALNNSNKIKTDTLPFNINYNQNDMIKILLEEIKYLKIKNELIKLKSNYQEIIFYTIKELIEDTKRDVSFNHELFEYINNFHNKILCILTQNNQRFYENLKIIDNDNNSDVLFAFNLKEDDIKDKLNQKNITVLNNIEDNIQNIIKNIDEITMNNDNNYNNNNEINSDFMLKMNKFKLHLLMASNNIVSYYLLSDNFNYQFKNRNKFIIFSPEDVANNQINQRKNKIKNDWEKLIKPLIHKVLTPKNEKELLNFIINLSLFYENLNKNICIENNALKINYDINNGKLNLLIQKIKNVIDNYINSNNDGFSKLSQLFSFIDENQSKKADAVIFSLINTEKQNYLNLIYNFELLKKAIYVI